MIAEYVLNMYTSFMARSLRRWYEFAQSYKPKPWGIAMRITYEPDVEKTDFLDIKLTQKEYYNLCLNELIQEIPMENGNWLNICIETMHEE